MTLKEAKTHIESEWEDSDGYWIDLKYGWTHDDPIGGNHGIHEDTKHEAYARLREIQPCHCGVNTKCSPIPQEAQK